MKCEICRESVATVHVRAISNDQLNAVHLCEACAQEKSVPIDPHEKYLSLPDFFGPLQRRDEP